MKFIYLLIMVSFVACKESKTSEKDLNTDVIITDSNDNVAPKQVQLQTANPEDYKKFQLLKNSDKFEYYSNQDSTLFVYPSFKISTINLTDNAGQMIHVFKEDKMYSIDTDAGWFHGVVGNNLIIMESTSSIGYLKVLNIDDLKERIAQRIVDDIELKENMLFFNEKIEIEDASKRPECPSELLQYKDQLGYVETVSFNLTTYEISRTGKIACVYFE